MRHRLEDRNLTTHHISNGYKSTQKNSTGPLARAVFLSVNAGNIFLELTVIFPKIDGTTWKQIEALPAVLFSSMSSCGLHRVFGIRVEFVSFS